MRAALLHLDDALRAQRQLTAAVHWSGGIDLDCRDLGPELRLWGRPEPLERLSARLRDLAPAGIGRLAVFAGSGDFHHLTPILLARALEGAGGRPATVVHFDNHPDWVRFEPGMHCGSWVGNAARLPGIARIVTIGVCSRDIQRPQARGADLELVLEDRVELYPYHAPGSAPALRICGREWPSIGAMGEEAFVDFVPSRIPTDDLYITIDKDVLRADDAATNWDQGQASLRFLTSMLSAIAERHRIIGVDVVGDWSKAVYGGGLLAQVLKRGEALMDQPWSRPDAVARGRNETVNLELFDLLLELGR